MITLRHGTITLDGNAQKLGTALGVSTLTAVSWLGISAHAGNAAVTYGGSSAVASTNYGFRIEAPASSIPSAPMIFEMPDNLTPLRLGGVYVRGTNTEKLAVMWMDF
jgi:hypothetical protein